MRRERETQSFYADCFYICSKRTCGTPSASYWSGLGGSRKSTFPFGRRNSTHCFFSNPSPCFRCVTSFTPPGLNSYLWIYFDISEWHILSARAWTSALMLYLTNPCAERKVLILTKPKDKIYKTKFPRNYITLVRINFSIRKAHCRCSWPRTTHQFWTWHHICFRRAGMSRVVVKSSSSSIAHVVLLFSLSGCGGILWGLCAACLVVFFVMRVCRLFSILNLLRDAFLIEFACNLCCLFSSVSAAHKVRMRLTADDVANVKIYLFCCIVIRSIKFF